VSANKTLTTNPGEEQVGMAVLAWILSHCNGVMRIPREAIAQLLDSQFDIYITADPTTNDLIVRMPLLKLNEDSKRSCGTDKQLEDYYTYNSIVQILKDQIDES
jgi:hypothetical protein